MNKNEEVDSLEINNGSRTILEKFKGFAQHNSQEKDEKTYQIKFNIFIIETLFHPKCKATGIYKIWI